MDELEAKKQKALDLYNIAKANLGAAAKTNDPTVLAIAAQAANDAWIAFKKMEAEVTNGLVLKNLRDLYHV
jgi:hypothetical protein